jgi:hypothetical protein
MNVVSLRLMLVSAGLTKKNHIYFGYFKYCPSGFQLFLGAKSLLNILYRPDLSFLLGSKSQAKFWWYFKLSFPFFPVSILQCVQAFGSTYRGRSWQRTTFSDQLHFMYGCHRILKPYRYYASMEHIRRGCGCKWETEYHSSLLIRL